jgi:ABC-type nitrate/sulfonate/bicarbonate transport system substrate-binding protein
VVESLLYHLLRAARWARENVADARRVLAAEVGAAEELVDAAYGPDWWTSLELELSDAALEGLVRQKALLREQGFLPADVDLAAFVDPRPLAAARRLARESASVPPAFEWQESRDASWSRADPTAAVAERR